MNSSTAGPEHGHAPTSEQQHSALFAHLLMQQTNMALMLMGKIPNPETGQPIKDLEAARLFIDMVEMLEAKTKGNLTNEESKLLKQSLMTLRLSFVEAVETPGQAKPEPPPAPPASQPPASQPAASQPAAGSEEKPTDPAAEEGRKKFSKKY